MFNFMCFWVYVGGAYYRIGQNGKFWGSILWPLELGAYLSDFKASFLTPKGTSQASQEGQQMGFDLKSKVD